MYIKGIPVVLDGAIRLYIMTSGLLTGPTSWLDSLGESVGYEGTKHYAIIIDAGSSSTKLLTYEFRERLQLYGDPTLVLEAELYKRDIRLSAFAEDPAAGGAMLVRMIQDAQSMIPPEKRSATPLLLRATAGLRLLPEYQSQALIDQAAIALNRLGYKMTPSSVSMMSSDDEGIFGWYTINLLLPPQKEGTIATIDLGGASVQISFELNEQDAKLVPRAYQHPIRGKDRTINLFSHSYLSMGHLAARYGILKMEANGTNTTEFTSVCVHPIVQREIWRYANIDYAISGAPRGPASRKIAYQRCHELARSYIQRTMDWEPPIPPRGKLAARGFLYYGAVQAGIIDAKKGGEATVAAYRASAHRACSVPDSSQPLACLDLAYVTALLQDGFKIDNNKPITLLSKVSGHDVSWPLGMAYNVVMDDLIPSSPWL